MGKTGVIIQGTKDGFKILHVSQHISDADKMAIGYDIRQAAPSENAIGKECYGLSFSPGGKVYTIYRSMYDSPRNMAVGFLGISLFIPFGLKAEGVTIQQLLNDLMTAYCRYAPENKLGALTEDWLFVEELLLQYEQRFEEIQEAGSYSSGSRSVAYIYYKEELLYDYFEDVYQRVYKKYRQILLLNENEKEVDNILLAVKQSDNITDSLNVKKPKYVLNNYNDTELTITANGDRIKSGDEISKEDVLKIKVEREYFHPFEVENSSVELSKKHPGIFFIDDIEKKITIKRPDLDFIEKKILISVKDGEKMLFKQDGITIYCVRENGLYKKDVSGGNEISFAGGEVENCWVLIVKGGEKYKDDTKIFKPKELSDNILKIPLERNQKVVNENGTAGDSAPAYKSDLQQTYVDRVANRVIKAGLVIMLACVVGASTCHYLINRTPSYTYNPSPASKTISKDQPPAEKNETILFPPKDLTDSVNNYAKGMDLDLNILNHYKQRLETFDTSLCFEVYLNLQNAIQVRSAVNSGDRKEIINAFKITGLEEEHNKLLKLIKKNDNLNELLQIEYRDRLSLNDIYSQLHLMVDEKEQRQRIQYQKERDRLAAEEKALREKRERERDKEKERNAEVQRFNKNGSYSYGDFIKMIKAIKTKADLKKFDNDKLDNYQAKLIGIIKDNIAEFKNIKGIANLSPKELTAAIINLSLQ